MTEQLIATNDISLGIGAATILDIFGTPGADPGLGQTGNFDDGKAVRKATVSVGKSVFDETEWEVYGDSATPQNTSDMDPREWAGASVPTTPAPTTPAPTTPAPTPVVSPAPSPDAVSLASPNLLMTEIADPKDAYRARYVEFYSNDGAGQAVGQHDGKDIYLTLFSNTNTDFNSNVKLTGTLIGSDGFLIICHNDSEFTAAYSGKTCDLASGSTVNSNGDDSYAVSYFEY